MGDIGLKKVQTALKRIRQELDAASATASTAGSASDRKAGPGENIWTAASDGDIARVEELMECEGLTPTSPDERLHTCARCRLLGPSGTASYTASARSIGSECCR